MSTEKNKALIRRWVEEGWNQWNVDLADEIIAPDFIYHGTEIRGIDGHKEWISWASGIMPDLQWTIEDMVAEGNKVAVRTSAIATHKGEWLGIPATGKQMKWTVTMFIHVTNDRLAEVWMEWDAYGVCRQLGGIPSLGEGQG